MVAVSKSIHVDADPESVFAFLDDPQGHVEVTPSLVDATNVEPLESGGKQLEFTYSIAGVKLAGELVQTVHDPDRRMTFEMSGQLNGEVDIEIEPDDGGSRVTYTGDYEIPGTVLARVAEPFVRRYNEREVDTLLANLKTRIEGPDDQ
ncbi:SRPBCC family protein [Salinibaculum rarum]|uniref:SRPBCC family protein n=1 Tax=Salinibaculum rarum TaxID=3058903 RepID=UPI00265F5B05|nr:SRPBCC family protein [Salinibaculum sp. KK48]